MKPFTTDHIHQLENSLASVRRSQTSVDGLPNDETKRRVTKALVECEAVLKASLSDTRYQFRRLDQAATDALAVKL